MTEAPSHKGVNRNVRVTLLFALSAIACDGESEREPDSDSSDAGHALDVLVGEVEDSDVRVGVLAGGDRLRVFLCGGPTSYETATRWVRTELEPGGDFHFSSDELALELTGTLVDGELEAELISDGERAVLSARRVRPDTLAGLYEARAECGTVGLIVAQDEPDSEPSAQGACVGDGHLPDQVNPIKPISRERDGTIAVEIVRGDEETRVEVAPASL
jgi:hypothetical protein